MQVEEDVSKHTRNTRVLGVILSMAQFANFIFKTTHLS